TPPEGEALLRDLLANWERFLHGEESLDPLIRMAVAHYQFEAIHPFMDGNGRTGRILNSLFLVEKGLLPFPILYLSRYIIAHKADYYRLLLAVTSDAAWEAWILYVLRGVEETAAWTTGKIGAVRKFAAETTDYVRRALQVPHGIDVADCHIVRELVAGDLVITADIPLASDVIAKGGHALNPRGELYSTENIAERLALRNYLDELRGTGERTGGPAA